MNLSVSAQLSLTPAQLLLQQTQAQLLAAAVQQSAGQQSSTTGANISASAATPITLSQPIQIASVSEWRLTVQSDSRLLTLPPALLSNVWGRLLIYNHFSPIKKNNRVVE